MKNTRIDVARDFSRVPGGRYYDDGDFSAEAFRENHLVPALETALQTGASVEVALDGTLGYGSSFLEEAFGGLVRVHGYDAGQLAATVVLKANSTTLVDRIHGFITDAGAVRNRG